jgi:lipopolysaccharide transport system permease protein
VLYAIDEFLRSVLAVRIWWAISLDDVMGRYRRTLLGPAWMILAQIMWIGGIYLLHSKFFGASAQHYMSYLAAGLAIWALISGLTADATGAFLRAKGHIESYPLPMPIHLMRSVTGSFITFFHLILVFAGTMVLERIYPSITMIAALPGLVIVAVFGTGMQLALAPIGARFRDIGPAVGSILNLVFILTPVFWVPTEAQLGNSLIIYNPFYYLLEVVRAPLLGSWGTPNLWLVASCIAVASLAAGLFIYARMRATIIYWL